MARTAIVGLLLVIAYRHSFDRSGRDLVGEDVAPRVRIVGDKVGGVGGKRDHRTVGGDPCVVCRTVGYGAGRSPGNVALFVLHPEHHQRVGGVHDAQRSNQVRRRTAEDRLPRF